MNLWANIHFLHDKKKTSQNSISYFIQKPWFNYNCRILFSHQEITRNNKHALTYSCTKCCRTRNWVLFSQIPTFSGHSYSRTFTLLAIRCCHFRNWLLCLGIRDGGLPCVGGINEAQGWVEDMLFIVRRPLYSLSLTARGANNQLQSQCVTHSIRQRQRHGQSMRGPASRERMLWDESFDQEELVILCWQGERGGMGDAKSICEFQLKVCFVPFY